MEIPIERLLETIFVGIFFLWVIDLLVRVILWRDHKNFGPGLPMLIFPEQNDVFGSGQKLSSKAGRQNVTDSGNENHSQAQRTIDKADGQNTASDGGGKKSTQKKTGDITKWTRLIAALAVVYMSGILAEGLGDQLGDDKLIGDVGLNWIGWRSDDEIRVNQLVSVCEPKLPKPAACSIASKVENNRENKDFKCNNADDECRKAPGSHECIDANGECSLANGECDKARKRATEFYYLAKNTVFSEETASRELRDISSRISLSSAMFFVSLFGLLTIGLMILIEFLNILARKILLQVNQKLHLWIVGAVCILGAIFFLMLVGLPGLPPALKIPLGLLGCSCFLFAMQTVVLPWLSVVGEMYRGEKERQEESQIAGVPRQINTKVSPSRVAVFFLITSALTLASLTVWKTQEKEFDKRVFGIFLDTLADTEGTLKSKPFNIRLQALINASRNGAREERTPAVGTAQVALPFVKTQPRQESGSETAPVEKLFVVDAGSTGTRLWMLQRNLKQLNKMPQDVEDCDEFEFKGNYASDLVYESQGGLASVNGIDGLRELLSSKELHCAAGLKHPVSLETLSVGDCVASSDEESHEKKKWGATENQQNAELIVAATAGVRGLESDKKSKLKAEVECILSYFTKATGIASRYRVIHGQLEAEYALKAAALVFPEKRPAIYELGGGSVQIGQWQSNGEKFVDSINCGTKVITDGVVSPFCYPSGLGPATDAENWDIKICEGELLNFIEKNSFCTLPQRSEWESLRRTEIMGLGAIQYAAMLFGMQQSFTLNSLVEKVDERCLKGGKSLKQQLKNLQSELPELDEEYLPEACLTALYIVVFANKVLNLNENTIIRTNVSMSQSEESSAVSWPLGLAFDEWEKSYGYLPGHGVDD